MEDNMTRRVIAMVLAFGALAVAGGRSIVDA